MRYALRGLDRDTTQQYLEHRLRLAGLDRPLFTAPAVEALWQASQGVMRRIDTLAHFALATAATQRATQIDPEHVARHNSEHLHSALRFVTPNDRHKGREAAILEHREEVYEQAQARRPERWSGSTPG